MKILHLISSHRWTGAADPAAGLALAQRALGHEVLFSCVAGASLSRIAHERGLHGVDGLDPRGGFHPLIAARAVARLREFLAHNPHDVVHCHLPHDHWLAALALSVPLPGGVPRPMLVRTLHRDRALRAGPAARWLMGRATQLVITVSEGGRQRALSSLGLDPARVRFIRGAVDLEKFRPGLDTTALREEWALPPGTPVVGIVAEMQPHRGHDLFIDTIDAVQHAHPNVRYLIVGGGEEKKRLRARMKSHRLAAHFIEAGYRKDDLAEVFNLMTVNVILAQGSDGSCRAVLEAMACGVPVIGVRLGAIAETIAPGETGWLIEPNDRPALEAAIAAAFSDPAGTCSMSLRAREAMEQNFSQTRRAEETLAAYEQLRARP